MKSTKRLSRWTVAAIHTAILEEGWSLETTAKFFTISVRHVKRIMRGRRETEPTAQIRQARRLAMHQLAFMRRRTKPNRWDSLQMTIRHKRWLQTVGGMERILEDLASAFELSTNLTKDLVGAVDTYLRARKGVIRG